MALSTAHSAAQGSALDSSRQVVAQPAGGQACHFLQRAGLFKQVSCSLHHLDPARRSQLQGGLPVEVENMFVAASDDEQGRCLYPMQGSAGEVGSTTP